MSKHGWTYKKLGEVCESKNNIIRAKSNFNPSDEIQYIDISSIDNRLFKIVNCTPYIFSNAPSRAQQVVRTGDIIISLVRPNLKNIAFVNDDSNNLVASSGFCVLRSKTINKGYLFHLIKSDTFTNYLLTRVSGANYPAVREDDIREYKIPVPPMAEQEAIVAELDEINEAIAALQQQVADLDTLAQATFYDMFGDPVTNPKAWPIKKLGEVATSKIGLTYKPTDVNEDGIVVLRSGNIQNSIIDLNDLVRVQARVPEDKIVRKNDILMCTRNGSFRLVGKVALIGDLEEKMTYGAFMTVIRSQYYNYLFNFFKSPAYRVQLGSAGTSTINQITVKMLNDLMLPIPPLALQQEFAARVEAIEAAKAELNAQIAEMQTLLASRMDYYFD